MGQSGLGLMYMFGKGVTQVSVDHVLTTFSGTVSVSDSDGL